MVLALLRRRSKFEQGRVGCALACGTMYNVPSKRALELVNVRASTTIAM